MATHPSQRRPRGCLHICPAGDDFAYQLRRNSLKPAVVRAKVFTPRASGATMNAATAAAGLGKTTGPYWPSVRHGAPAGHARACVALRLLLEERETISRGLAQHKRFVAITAERGRPVSTVSRELARNSGPGEESTTDPALTGSKPVFSR